MTEVCQVTGFFFIKLQICKRLNESSQAKSCSPNLKTNYEKASVNLSNESSEGTLAISYSIKDESYLQEIKKINKN